MEKEVEVKTIVPKQVTIKIVGDSDLVLNKMNDVSARGLIDKRKDKAKSIEKPNVWEEIITSMHWRDGKPESDPNTWTEKTLRETLKHNAPCISAFGLYKSFGDALVRNEIDTYATKFRASVNISAEGGLVPIKFAQHFIDEKLMSPKKGSPVLVHLNRFTGWNAEITISYLENVYGLEQIINIINLAGFGIGIGSGRSSGYGRYHVENAE